jgi:hypothetical protein
VGGVEANSMSSAPERAAPANETCRWWAWWHQSTFALIEILFPANEVVSYLGLKITLAPAVPEVLRKSWNCVLELVLGGSAVAGYVVSSPCQVPAVPLSLISKEFENWTRVLSLGGCCVPNVTPVALWSVLRPRLWNFRWPSYSQLGTIARDL